MAKKVTQRDRVLQYIRDFGSITSWQAYEDLGIELKALGYVFKKERVYKDNRYGARCHFDKYMLVEE